MVMDMDEVHPGQEAVRSHRASSPSLLSLRKKSHLFLLCAVGLALCQVALLSFQLSIATGPSAAPDPLPANPRDPGANVALPDGTATFTPDEFAAGRPQNYVNLPLDPPDSARDRAVLRLLEAAVPPPAETLLRAARPAPAGRNAVLGLASYPTFEDGWRKLVGSLRAAGYDGHIILGVHPAIPPDERAYLDRHGVTYYAVATTDCDAAILDGAAVTDNAVRARCSRGLEDLKLEWGRYEMARRWLRACAACTGWSLVLDTRDVFFQADPFRALGDPTAAAHDLLFVEEVARHTNTLPESPHRATNLGESRRYQVHVHPCYGKAEVRAPALADRPMLCSGTVLGTRAGTHRFLSVLVDEFRTNNARGPLCRSPATTDQWTMNHLYYRGRFGRANATKTLPWGTGPVLTVGKPCVDSALDSKQGRGQKDMMVFDKHGRVLNPHERDGSATRVAPALHQWDRCQQWIKPWFREHAALFASPNGGGT